MSEETLLEKLKLALETLKEVRAALEDAGEAKYGPEVAGSIIYHNSVGMVPDFYCNNADALADIKACAGLK